MSFPARQIRALHTDDTITVYQAYSAEIADAALRAGRFVAPFKRNRMTWIKPSFLWMMYRCGWAAKAGQERVLAVELSRAGFDRALADACLSHYDRHQHVSREHWQRTVRASPVRIQWDPERSLTLAELPHRSLQVGLSGAAVDSYVDEWTVGLSDVTDRATEIHRRLRAGRMDDAQALLPAERPYALPARIAAHIGADPG